MSTMVLPMASPKSLKRNFDEVSMQEGFPERNDEPQSALASPIPSSMPSSTPQTQLAPSTSNLNQAAPPADSSKKPKLSFAEKEAQRIEKEFKEQQKAEDRIKKEQEKLQREKEKVAKEEERLKKAEEKAAKEEERLKKADEKKQKDEERRKIKEEKDKVKEEERIKREEEKQKKDEEKAKKERSQLRLNAFFVQPAGASRSPTGSPRATPSASRRGSLVDIKEEDLRRSRSVSAAPFQQASDFERAFPEFYIHPHVTLAPSNKFSRDDLAISHTRGKLDERLFGVLVKQEKALLEDTKVNFNKILELPPRKRQRRIPPSVSVKSIISQIDGAAQNPIDLTSSKKPDHDPAEALKHIPVKFIKFYQDVRPPYKGTYTKITSPTQVRKFARNPFIRYRPDTDYDYDSEAEWEDPGEGEDLLSEDEEEPEEDDDDDINEFLDNEDIEEKRRPHLGNMETSCTGICWAEDDGGPDLSQFRIDMLKEVPTFPINPYSTTYWPKPMPPPSIPAVPTIDPTTFPPTVISKVLPTDAQDTITSAKQAKKLIPLDLLLEFKAAVEGSDATKVVLVDILKRKFPKHSKDVLKDSLDAVAERKGVLLKDRKWVLKEGI